MKRNKILKKIIVGIGCVSVLVLIFFIRESKSVMIDEEESIVVSMDLSDERKGYIADREIKWLIEDFESATHYFYEDYKNYKEYILYEYPNFDTVKIDEFAQNIMNLRKEYLDLKIRLTDEIISKGPVSPYRSEMYPVSVDMYSELLTAHHKLIYNTYKATSDFINESKDVLIEDKEIFDAIYYIIYYLNPLYFYESPPLFRSYSKLEYDSAYLNWDHIFFDENFNAAYDEIYLQLKESAKEPEERIEIIINLFAEALEEWIDENLDIFLVNVIDQANLYYELLREIGYVYNLDNNRVEHYSFVDNGRPLILADIIEFPFPVAPEYHFQGMLNEYGTDFLPLPKIKQHLLENTSFMELSYLPDEMRFQAEHFLLRCFDNWLPEKECYLEYFTMYYLSTTVSAVVEGFSYVSPSEVYLLIIYDHFHNAFSSENHSLLEYGLPQINNWIDPKYGMMKYNYYRKKMVKTIPKIDIKEYSTINKTRTIHFIYEDGTQAHESIVQTAHIGIVKELISGITRPTTDDEHILHGLDTPTTYFPDTDIMMIPNIDTIPEITMTMDSENEEITVVYYLSGKSEETIDTSEPESENNKNEALQTPNTLSRVSLVIYIISAILVASGIIILLLSRKKKEELEII